MRIGETARFELSGKIFSDKEVLALVVDVKKSN
jgi:hypothetical protein